MTLGDLISIHTTLAGGDGDKMDFAAQGKISIHTTLAGGDEWIDVKKKLPENISIHTTLAGGDQMGILVSFILLIFQSTPPSRVATSDQGG